MDHSFLVESGWQIAHARTLPGRPPAYVPVHELPLHARAQAFLRGFREGVYRHQHLALDAFLQGADVCLATGTASGKSLVFYAAGIELLARDPLARIVAIYPMRALGREQEERWRQAFRAAGLPAQVGRIDGSVTSGREAILRQCQVVLFTPDVIHAWLLGSLSVPAVRSFLQGVRLVVVDEVHVYSGVFGSNAAFLFRRLQHASGGASMRFIAASATVADPEEHLRKLFARPFRIVGSEHDSSPRHPLDVLLVRPPAAQDLNTAVAALINALARGGSSRFIAFVDSRRQTERLATIAVREGGNEGGVAAGHERGVTHLAVLPYRSGYEEEDRAAIQERLSRGDLRGVISTSALELGIDIRGLDTAVLLGVPHTATSLQQRMGRIGRQGPGRVIVVDAGGIADRLVFRDPDRLFDRPPSPSALYLENRRIQYVQGLCFAGAGAEYDMLAGAQPGAGVDPDIRTAVEWPEGFLDLCRRERLGEVPPELQPLKADCGDNPWHAFPLRDVGSQFHVEMHAHDISRLGSLSYAQLMREAYPGAVYYYMTKPYRVTRVFIQERKVVVRPERYYTTDPAAAPPLVSPNLQGEGLHQAIRFGDLRVVECGVYVSEMLFGFNERRGNQTLQVKYPCEYWTRDRFSRNYSTTGVLLSHPALDLPHVQVEDIAEVILEAFLLIAPFDRSEVACSAGRHRVARLGFAEGDRFVAIFDQTYGSLRLTSRLMEESTLRAVLREAGEIARDRRLEELEPLNDPTLQALAQLTAAAQAEPAPFGLPDTAPPVAETARQVVIMPGSMGWIITDDNQEFQIERVFYHPTEGLRYYGRRPGTPPDPRMVNWFPIANVRPIPGVSKLGEYDFETGEVRPLED